MANHINLNKKDKEILKLLSDNPEGIRARNIAKYCSSKGRTCYNHLKKLEKYNLIKNFYPIWKIWQSSDVPEKLAKLLDNDNTEGHRITWILPLINKPYWWDKRKDRLMRLHEWTFKSEVTANNNIYHQIQNNSMQIQTYKNSIYFICKKYSGKTDLDIFNKSKDDVLEAIRYLEEQFRFKFLSENHFHLTLLDSHYVTLKDILAETYYAEGKRFRVETKEGYYIWVDFSDPRGLEGNNVEAKRRYLELVKDVADNPLVPLPSELAKFQAENSQELKILIEMNKIGRAHV